MSNNQQPLGAILHNPFDLRGEGIDWLGLASPRSIDGFCNFRSDFYGLRAGFRNLWSAYVRHGRKTIRSIVSAYAPASENDTAAYIAAICSRMGIDADTDCRLDVQANRLALGRAIIEREIGAMPYSPNQLYDADKAANEGKEIAPMANAASAPPNAAFNATTSGGLAASVVTVAQGVLDIWHITMSAKVESALIVILTSAFSYLIHNLSNRSNRPLPPGAPEP